MSADADDPTTSEEIVSVQAIESRLRALLDKAQHQKQTTSIDPPLQPTTFDASILSLAEPPATTFSPADLGNNLHTSKSPIFHVALETAARTIFYPLVTTIPIASPDFSTVWNLLDILQFCADHSQCDPSLPLRHVEELLDSQTIDGCKHVFDYMESRRERLMGLPLRHASAAEGGDAVVAKKERDTLTRNKEMIVLRSCNELLRRLSRAEDTVFCGRVFMFLFQSFELGNKASVNLRGEFHTENVTVFDLVGAGEEGKEDEMEVDGDAKGEENAEEKPADAEADATMKTGEDEPPVDKEAEAKPQEQEEEVDIDTLYTSFWSLQHVFSNPTTLFAKEEFETFKKRLDMTIKKFKSMPKVLQTQGTPRASGGDAGGLKRKRTRDGDEFASNFNPKYLTSRDLFELEMSDLTFQRHVLIQMLITLDFLLSLTTKATAKLSTLKAQKALLYPYILSPTDTQWALDTRAQIALYLQDGPDGKFYYRMADTVLARDKNWVRWKVESCPPISRPPVSTTQQMEAVRGAKRTCAPRRIKANPMGAIDLGFVSDVRNVNGLDTLRNPERCRVPAAEKWVEEVERINLDLEMADKEEEEYMKEGRTTALWRALRVAARTKFKVLDEVDEGERLKVLKGEGLEGEGRGPVESGEGAEVNVDETDGEAGKAEDVVDQVAGESAAKQEDAEMATGEEGKEEQGEEQTDELEEALDAEAESVPQAEAPGPEGGKDSREDDPTADVTEDTTPHNGGESEQQEVKAETQGADVEEDEGAAGTT